MANAGSFPILIVDINAKGEGKRFENVSSRKMLLPDHPILISLGFKEYVDLLKGK